jgi:hypothetical protein
MSTPPEQCDPQHTKPAASITEAPRTVLISSRIDELGSARRAAFRAVHDAGWIPLLYEVEPYEWLAAHLPASPGQSRILQESHVQRLNERLSMDALLEKAEHFIGIYGTSLGDPSPQLCGLRPLEYELLRFLYTHAFPGDDSLRWLFSVGSSPETCQKARLELRRALADVSKEGTKYHTVFNERVALFLKIPAGDVPASSQLYETIFNLSHKKSAGPVHLFKSKLMPLPNGGTVYWRPSSRLYLKIRTQIRHWSTNVSAESGNNSDSKPTYWIKVWSLDRLGFALDVAEAVFYAGYNVLHVLMGREREGSETRVMYVEVEPYLNGPPVETLLADLYYKHRYEVELHEGMPEQPLPHLCTEPAWRLEAHVADRPGMLARVLTALALIERRILNITIEHVPSNEGSSAGARNEVTIIFYQPAQLDRNDKRKSFRNQSRDSDLPDSELYLATDFVAAELTSIPGFYSVTQVQRCEWPPCGHGG